MQGKFRLLWVLTFFIYGQLSHAQSDTAVNKKRLHWVIGGGTAVYGGSLLLLNEAWYKEYPRSSFHWINDNASWLQIDKFGHAYTSYAYGLAGIELFRWTGVSERKAIWWGGMLGTIFQTPIEVLDGFSAEWGASWGDLLANSAGTALLISQELKWKEQRFQLKFSYAPTNFARLRPNMLGNSWYSSILKDYNGQTYWLSASPRSFKQDLKWPKWLNLSLGYGGHGMLGGTTNQWEDADGNAFDFSHINRQRQLLFSLDINTRAIKTDNQFLKKCFFLINMIKIPAPAIEWRESKGLYLHPLFF